MRQTTWTIQVVDWAELNAVTNTIYLIQVDRWHIYIYIYRSTQLHQRDTRKLFNAAELSDDVGWLDFSFRMFCNILCLCFNASFLLVTLRLFRNWGRTVVSFCCFSFTSFPTEGMSEDALFSSATWHFFRFLFFFFRVWTSLFLPTDISLDFGIFVGRQAPRRRDRLRQLRHRISNRFAPSNWSRRSVFPNLPTCWPLLFFLPSRRMFWLVFIFDSRRLLQLPGRLTVQQYGQICDELDIGRCNFFFKRSASTM